MATRTTTTNRFYMKYAEREMLIDEGEQGLFCDVPSETTEGKCHRVHVDETTVVPVAVHCTCACFEHKGSCKHQVIANNFYARIYKSNLGKFVAKVEAAEQESVAQIEAPAEVAQVEETPVEPHLPIAMDLPEELKGRGKVAKSVDIGTKGNLNGQRGFSILKIA